MLLSAVSVLVVAQSSSEIQEVLMNNPVYLLSEKSHRTLSSFRKKGNDTWLHYLKIQVFWDMTTYQLVNSHWSSLLLWLCSPRSVYYYTPPPPQKKILSVSCDVLKSRYVLSSLSMKQKEAKPACNWSFEICENMWFNPYPTAFPYGNGMVLHFYQQRESSTTKTVHRIINKGLKT